MEEAKNEGFLSRWSRRKAAARVGNAPPEVPVDGPDAPVVSRQNEPSAPGPDIGTDVHECLPPPGRATNENAEAPPLSLEDVAKLTRDSDFSRFVASGVDPAVKNAALKKLFTDPHFNSMDGLDVYIDDYNAASPLPQHLLVKMAQARFLGLVKQSAQEALSNAMSAESAESRPADAEVLRRPAQDDTHLPGVRADDADQAAPVQAAIGEPLAHSIAPHEDADLQLQPDDDAGRSGAASGAGEDAGRQH